jgi:hypothetical protein
MDNKSTKYCETPGAYICLQLTLCFLISFHLNIRDSCSMFQSFGAVSGFTFSINVMDLTEIYEVRFVGKCRLLF